MNTKLLIVRLVMAITIFSALILFLIITPILVAADAEPLGQIITGTATSYAYLPIVFQTAVEGGVTTLSEHSDTFVTASIYGFMGFGLMLGVVGLFMPFVNKEEGKEENEQNDA